VATNQWEGDLLKAVLSFVLIVRLCCSWPWPWRDLPHTPVALMLRVRVYNAAVVELLRQRLRGACSQPPPL